jgi:rubrerythrin
MRIIRRLIRFLFWSNKDDELKESIEYEKRMHRKEVNEFERQKMSQKHKDAIRNLNEKYDYMCPNCLFQTNTNSGICPKCNRDRLVKI